MLRRASLVTAAAAALAAAPALAQNLFTNPGFETGDFTGWIVPAGSRYTGMAVGTDGTDLPPSPTELNVRSGFYAGASGVPSPSFFNVTQTVAVEPVRIYEIGAWISLGLNFGGAAGFLTIQDDQQNTFGAEATAWGGITPDDFIRVSRLYQTRPGQTSATITLEGSLGGRTSWDDLFMVPWTTPATPVTDTRPILAVGDVVPPVSGSLWVVDPPVLNNQGRVAALGRTTATPAEAFLLFDDPAGRFVPLRTGDSLGSIGTLSSISRIALNDNGDVAFRGATTGSGATSGIFRRDADSGSVSVVAAVGGSSPDGNGTFQSFLPLLLGDTTPRISNAGVAFTAVLQNTAGGTADDQGLFYLPEGGSLRTVARKGAAAPGGGFYDFSVSSSASPAVNDAGTIAFVARTNVTDHGLFLDRGNGVERVASYSNVEAPSQPAINGNGDIAVGVGGAVSLSRIDVLRSGTYGTVVAAGTSTPVGSTFSTFAAPALNDLGQVAFIARLTDGRSGVFRTEASGEIVPIALSTQQTPEGAGTFVPFDISNGDAPTTPGLTAGGQVAFANYVLSASDQTGIYLADPSEVVYVARWGHALQGSVITGFRWGMQRAIQVNDAGQIVYSAVLADGRTTDVIYTPTLRWRSTQPGAWSNSNNWTVGLAPAAVHPVIIDSPAGVDVTLPSGSTAVKSLEVGAGNALTLSPGSDLTAADGVVIDAGAFLKGSGTIHGDVTSAGTLAPGSSAGTMTIDGDYTQTGTLELELLADGFDQLLVTGTLTLGGDIIVTGSADPGQQFNLVSAAAFTGTANWHLPGESSFQLISLPGGGQTMKITYVPDPASLSLVMIPLIVLRRSRRL